MYGDRYGNGTTDRYAPAPADPRRSASTLPRAPNSGWRRATSGAQRGRAQARRRPEVVGSDGASPPLARSPIPVRCTSAGRSSAAKTPEAAGHARFLARIPADDCLGRECRRSTDECSPEERMSVRHHADTGEVLVRCSSGRHEPRLDGRCAAGPRGGAAQRRSDVARIIATGPSWQADDEDSLVTGRSDEPMTRTSRPRLRRSLRDPRAYSTAVTR